MLESTVRSIQNRQYRETGNIGYTRQRKTKHNTTQYAQTNTNSVNKRRSLLQITGGKDDEPNIAFMRKS
jgi:hypothetical protein